MHNHGDHMTMTSNPRAGETMHECADSYMVSRGHPASHRGGVCCVTEPHAIRATQLRPIRNILGWQHWVLTLTAKERNQVIAMYQLTDSESTSVGTVKAHKGRPKELNEFVRGQGSNSTKAASDNRPTGQGVHGRAFQFIFNEGCTRPATCDQ